MNRAIRTQVFWQADIAAILRGLAVARLHVDPGAEEYECGYLAALGAIATAFGLDRAENGNVRQIECRKDER